MQQLNIILFDGVTTLDALGPAEVFSRLAEDYIVHYFSPNGGLITTSTGNEIRTANLHELSACDVLLIPGGMATRTLVNDTAFISELTRLARLSEYVLTVCTGSALLAKTGLLNHHSATSNKRAWAWVTAQNSLVNWVKKARWVVDGKYYTSSGVTAGIDMSLGFIRDRFNEETANEIASSLEYIWNRDSYIDLFAD